MQTLISVVMPNYNGERFVEAAIRSVQQQTYRDFELIVVDDCSTDRSPALIARLAETDTRIRLIRKEKNAGVSAARNTGIQAAKGSFIALLDNDDLWEEDKLERQLALARMGADIVYCSYDFIDESGAFVKRPFLVPARATFRSMLGSNLIGCSTAFVRAELLKAHPFSAVYYHEDYVLWMELLKGGAVARGEPKVLMHYRLVTGSRSNRKGNAAKERWIIFRKALGLSLPASALAFTQYAINSLIKYYF